MEFSVGLQEPFQYSSLPILLGIVLMAVIGIVCVILCCRSKQPEKMGETKKVESPSENKNQIEIKHRYITRLEEIETRLNKQELDVRIAYQIMSLCLREFVSEITGVSITHFTLSELKQKEMPVELIRLIEEYYQPEFSKESEADFKQSLEKTKQVVEQWN